MQKKYIIQNNVHKTTFLKTEVARRCISISIITMVYAPKPRSAASYSVLPGLQPRLQTAASADTTEAAIVFTAPGVTATVVVASLATTADLLMSASLLQTQQQTW
jgi:hypothetical protein